MPDTDRSAPATAERPERELPRWRLSETAWAYWTLEVALIAAAALIGALVVRAAVGDQGDIVRTIGRAAVWIVLGGGVTAAALVPVMRVRRWRWELRDDEIDLRHGTLTEHRTIVPMSRVQHVELVRAPLGRFFGLATIIVHTAAGEVEIPALDDRRAVAARDQIADLARAPDDL